MPVLQCVGGGFLGGYYVSGRTPIPQAPVEHALVVSATFHRRDQLPFFGCDTKHTRTLASNALIFSLVCKSCFTVSFEGS